MYRSFYTLRTGFNSAVRALKLVIDRHVSSKMHISKYIGFSTAGLLGTSMSLVSFFGKIITIIINVDFT